MNESTDLQEKQDLGGLEVQRLWSNCHNLQEGRFCKGSETKEKQAQTEKEQAKR